MAGSGAALSGNDSMQPSPLDLEVPNDHLDDDGRPRRTGNVRTASAHIVIVVIGSGVLSLSWSIAQMGWIAGLVVMLLFAWCTLYTSLLLADCYRCQDPATGNQNYIYLDVVKTTLSQWEYWICGLMQYSTLIGTSITYLITAASCAGAMSKLECPECLRATASSIAIYGAIQIILSLIPNFRYIWWRIYGGITVLYCFIVLGLSIGKSVTKQSHDYGTISGIPIGDPSLPGYETEAQKVSNILIALGNIAFAYSYSMNMIEIQDTLRCKPAEYQQMKRATYFGVSTTTFLYVSIGITGYTAFGNNVCGNILTCFTKPYWLVIFSNTWVIIHLFGSFQVYSQPVFEFVETLVEKRFPNNKSLTESSLARCPGGITFEVSIFRVTWRTAYVVLCTVIAMLLPFFNDIQGVIGALGFWPLTVYFPIAMYIVRHKIKKFSGLWIGLQALSFVTFLVSLAALIGSVQGIIIDVRNAKLFAANQT